MVMFYDVEKHAKYFHERFALALEVLDVDLTASNSGGDTVKSLLTEKKLHQSLELVNEILGEKDKQSNNMLD